MSLSSKVLESDNRTGFFIGPTLKIGMPLGFDFDSSILYDQRNAALSETEDNGTTVAHPEKHILSLQANLRKGFGFGDKASFFIYAGPQFGLNLGNKTIFHLDDIDWRWKQSDVSINMGVGIMLLNRIEIKANYNISCGKAYEIRAREALQQIGEEILSPRANAFQIGLAIYL